MQTKYISLWTLALMMVLPAVQLRAQQDCPPHEFVDGFCSKCNQADVEYLYPDRQGFYQISTPQALRWFAEYVALDASHATLCARLTADLDMSGVPFIGLGSAQTPYEGEFDGDGHTIINLVIDKKGKDAVGFINAANGDTWIHDLTLGSGCVINGNSHVGGFVGRVVNTKGNDIRFERLGFEGTLNVDNNGGAIVGCVPDNNVHAYFKSCYTVGVVNGNFDNGALSGWSSSAQIINCYAKVQGKGFQDGSDVVRGFPSSYTNSYASGAVQKNEGLGSFTDEELKNGTLLKKLADQSYQQKDGDANPKLRK